LQFQQCRLKTQQGFHAQMQCAPAASLLAHPFDQAMLMPVMKLASLHVPCAQRWALAIKG
jgi:hypothetical protein